MLNFQVWCFSYLYTRFPFTKEHIFVTWEGSYQSYVVLGGAFIGQGRKSTQSDQLDQP